MDRKSSGEHRNRSPTRGRSLELTMNQCFLADWGGQERHIDGLTPTGKMTN